MILSVVPPCFRRRFTSSVPPIIFNVPTHLSYTTDVSTISPSLVMSSTNARHSLPWNSTSTFATQQIRCLEVPRSGSIQHPSLERVLAAGRQPPRSQAQSDAPSLSIPTLPPSSAPTQVLNVQVVCGTIEAAGRLTHVLKLKAACLVSLTIDILGIPRAPRSGAQSSRHIPTSRERDAHWGLSRRQANPTLGSSSIEFMNTKLSALLPSPSPSPPRRVAAHS
ncbi:hypothetical protein R3P38DRAFT_3211667 [Favolaschia claudopus]|uniref:Uncharacterized protein n=1 Tax=Favolaschia claudopus TaxID=2862362 RepID=A0AAW0AFB7_9AGAR